MCLCQVALGVFVHLGSCCLVQLEALLGRVLLRIAEGRTGGTVEQQEAALEGVLDLCRQRGFIQDIFLNCDCRYIG